MRARVGLSPRLAHAACPLVWLALALAAPSCATEDQPDLRVGDDGTVIDVPALPLPAPGQLLEVSHPRELRAAWVATVWNIDYPTSAGAGAAQQTQELRDLINGLADLGVNAIFLQVRAECDALYVSSLEPWSRVLTGAQGQAPGFDPLDVAIQAAHARGIELHAWINPYRARIAGASAAATAPNHISQTHPSYVVAYNNQLWLDPGQVGVRSHVLAVIDDLIAHYPVDGIHFDDYFYPYPAAGQAFPDQATYAAYVASGGTLALGDWRRTNVNQLVAGVATLLSQRAPNVRFGISPFGIYRPGMPAGINGLDAYDQLYADALTWANNGWVDYLAPQLYWPTTQTAQSFTTLLPWWAEQIAAVGDDANAGRYTVAGINASNYLASPAWTLGEFATQLALVTSHRAHGVRGVAVYHAKSLTQTPALAELFANAWQTPALPPASVGHDQRPAPAQFHADAASRTLTIDDAGRYTLYQRQGDAWALRAILVAPSTTELGEGTFAIARVGLDDVESLAKVIVVPGA